MAQTSEAGWFKNVMYPANKDMIRNMAQENGAPQDVLDKIDQMDQTISFRSPSEIFATLGYEGYEHIEKPGPQNIPEEKLSEPGATTLKTTRPHTSPRPAGEEVSGYGEGEEKKRGAA